MENKITDYVIEQAKALINAHSCCTEAKAATQSFLSSIGTDNEAEAVKSLLAELKADVTSIDDLIGLLSSDMGAKIFGKEQADKMLSHANEIKANGAKYCDCPACAASVAILESMGSID